MRKLAGQMAEWTKDAPKELKHVFCRFDTEKPGQLIPPPLTVQPDGTLSTTTILHSLPVFMFIADDSVVDYPPTPVDQSTL